MSSLPAELLEPSSGFRRDPRFDGSAAPTVSESVPVEDPVQTAFEEGFAKGFEEAQAQALAQAQEDNAARDRIETAFAQLNEADGLQLEQRLRETILLLCENLIKPLATEPDALADRVSKALNMLRRSGDERVVRLHPDDLVMIADRLAEDIKAEPDPSLERGELRIESTDGGLQDGPEQWRRALSEALEL